MLLEPGKSYLLFLMPADGDRWLPITKGVNPIATLSDLIDRVGGEPLDQVIAELGGGA